MKLALTLAAGLLAVSSLAFAADNNGGNNNNNNGMKDQSNRPIVAACRKSACLFMTRL